MLFAQRLGLVLPRSYSPLVVALASLAFAQVPLHAQANDFAYVANIGSNKVSGYKVNPATGTFTPVPGSPFQLPIYGPSSVAADPTGRFVYVTDGSVFGFRIEENTGRLIALPGSPYTAGSGPKSVAIHPSGKFAYVANAGSNSVSAFRLEPVTGRLVEIAGSPFATGNFPLWAAVDPAGRFLYTTNENSNDVSGFAINSTTGALTPINGSPFIAGAAPQSLAITPRGQYAYVANLGTNDVSGYSIDSTTGALTSLGSFTVGMGGAFGVSVDPTGKHVYATAFGGVYGYTINTVSTCFPCVPAGALTPLPGSPFGTGTNIAYGQWTPNSIAFDYTASFAYATGGPYGPGTVTAFNFNATSGIPTQFAGAPFSTGDGSVSIALVRPRPAVEYTAKPIPDQAYSPLISVSAAGINRRGDVAASALVQSGNEVLGFSILYANGTTGSGGGLPSHSNAAHALNNNGFVVGDGEVSPPLPGYIPRQAFLFNGSNTINLDGRQGGQSSATSINYYGRVAGWMSTGTCAVNNFGVCQMPPPAGTHAFLYAGSGLIDIGTLGGDNSAATGINDNGEIVGNSNLTVGGPLHIFLYTGGSMHDLGSGNAVAINNKGEITGFDASGLPFFYDGSFHPIPNPPGGSFNPTALNNYEAVVGEGSFNSSMTTHAVISSGGHSHDLNDLVLSSLPLFTRAAGINNVGQIVVEAIDGQLYVLTPIQ